MRRDDRRAPLMPTGPLYSRKVMMRFAALGILVSFLMVAEGAAAPVWPVDDLQLIAAARAEGSVVVYGAISGNDLSRITERFEAQYGIKAQGFRIQSDQLPAKLILEQRGRVYNADLQISLGFQTEQLRRANMLAAYRPPENKDVISGAYDPAGYWSSVNVDTDAIGYNPVKVRELGLHPPASWADLTRPEWRGQIAIYRGAYDWYLTMKREIGASAADRLLRGFAANGARLTSSHNLTDQQAAAGEYAVALASHAHDILRLKKLGQPLELVNAAPTVAELVPISILKEAPHPNAARLFERWVLSRDTQQWIVSALERISARKDVQNDAVLWNAKMRIVISQPPNSADLSADIRTFNAIFGVR
jgi:iron(III) transport system substrate-binding protein